MKNIRFVLAIFFLGFLAVSLTTCEHAELTNISVTPGNLGAPSIAPGSLTIPMGFNQQYTASGRFSDLTTRDLTTQVTWTSSKPSVATVSSSGLATAIAPGFTTISATTPTSYNPSGHATGSVTLTVVPALSSIALTPTNPNTPLGVNQQFTATGTYSDGTSRDITTQVIWTSSNTSMATINSSGLATAVTVGAATITATQGGISQSTTLTVTAATLSSIAVTPVAPSIPVRVNQQFTAIGTYSDGATEDITAQVTWSSSNTSVATVNGSGLATAVAVGPATITATQGSISGSGALTVNPATLASIALTPATPSIPAGVNQRFTATGTYSDGTIFDITAQVTWTTSDVSVTQISTSGLATGVVPGAVTIAATQGSIVGSTTLTVTAATLSSIAVTPAFPSIPVGFTQVFIATGTYSDGTIFDITTRVTWSSSNTALATVNVNVFGLATAVSAGTAAIIATQGLTTGSTFLTITSG